MSSIEETGLEEIGRALLSVQNRLEHDVDKYILIHSRPDKHIRYIKLWQFMRELKWYSVTLLGDF